ncbi:hypothetical protein H7X65_03210 [Candidatus Parcubacteria bacterium]|nr:hypothetical protein [Candidatus Parcubacteria bacterium]
MNNKKIIISILVLIALILSIILFNKTGPQVMNTDEVATTTSATATTTPGKMVVNPTVKQNTSTNESSQIYNYENGVYWGIIKKSAITGNKLVLTIDFLQTFETHKEMVLASIQDDICKYPSNMGIKSKQEFYTKVSGLQESQISDYMATSGCFPNGIEYYRNASALLRSKDVAANFIAYYPKAPSDELTNTGSITTLNGVINTQGPANPRWQITIKNNKVVELYQPFTP